MKRFTESELKIMDHLKDAEDQITALQAKVKELEGREPLILILHQALSNLSNWCVNNLDFKQFEEAKKFGFAAEEALTATQQTAERVRRQIGADAIEAAVNACEYMSATDGMKCYSEALCNYAQQLRGGGEK